MTPNREPDCRCKFGKWKPFGGGWKYRICEKCKLEQRIPPKVAPPERRD